MGDMINDAFRNIIWMITSFCLGIMDLIYSVVERIAILDVGDFGWIWTWFTAVCAFLVLFLICRVGFDFFKAMADEDFRDKVDPVRIVKKVLVVAVIIGMLPIVLPSFSEFAGEMNAKVGDVLTGGKDMTPSSVIVSVGYNGDPIDYDTININEKVDKTYKYFPSNFDIMFTLVGSCIACVLYVFIAIQIGQRIFSLLMKILVAPFSVSSLVSFEENSFDTWVKLVVADLVTTWVQLAMLMLVLTGVVSVNLGDDLIAAIAKVIFFIAGLMIVMNAPTGLAQLLGGDVGTGTALQQMQNLQIVGQGMNMAGHAMNAAVTAGAAGVYGGGRLAGGVSMLGNAGNAIGSMMNGGNNAGGSSVNNVSGMAANAAGTVMNNTASVSEAVATDTPTSANYSSPYQNVREGTFAAKMADSFSNTGVGRVINKAGASMYKISANRLSKPVAKRTSTGTVMRNSNFVRGHNMKEAVKSGYHAYKGDVK